MSERTARAAPAIESPSSRPMDRPRRLPILLAFIAEILVFAAASSGQTQFTLLLAAHLAVVALLAAATWRSLLSGSDGGFSLLAVLATLAMGPFGAAGVLLLPALAASKPAAEARLSAWYRRIALSAEQDEFTLVSDRIAMGRAANLDAPAPAKLGHEFTSGAISTQQAALGMIARNFHPAYLPVLKIALSSPEPVIRVQAAAVAARVREILKRDIGAMLTRAADANLSPTAAVILTADLDAVAGSGLLETQAHDDAHRLSRALEARTFARIDATLSTPDGGTLPLTSPIVADAYLSHLLDMGRVADFRAARARVRLHVSGRYRRRRLILTEGVNGLRRSGTLPGAHA